MMEAVALSSPVRGLPFGTQEEVGGQKACHQHIEVNSSCCGLRREWKVKKKAPSIESEGRT